MRWVFKVPANPKHSIMQSKTKNCQALDCHNLPWFAQTPSQSLHLTWVQSRRDVCEGRASPCEEKNTFGVTLAGGGTWIFCLPPSIPQL